MILKPSVYEELLRSVAQDSWSRLSYIGDLLELRLVDVKRLDAGSRIYFDGKREQVVSGLRYAPGGSSPYRMWPEETYRITTQIEFVKPMPEGMMAQFYVNEDLARAGLFVTANPILEGFRDRVAITAVVSERLEIQSLCAIGYLAFYGEDRPVTESEEVEDTPVEEIEKTETKKKSTSSPSKKKGSSSTKKGGTGGKSAKETIKKEDK